MRQRFGIAVALLANPKLVIVDEPAGRTFVHVHNESSPGPEFESVEPDLKDVYFTAMAGHNGLRRAQADAGVVS